MNSAHEIGDEDLEFFRREGYLVRPGLIDAEFNARLRTEVDELMIHRADGDHRLLVPTPKWVY